MNSQRKVKRNLLVAELNHSEPQGGRKEGIMEVPGGLNSVRPGSKTKISLSFVLIEIFPKKIFRNPLGFLESKKIILHNLCLREGLKKFGIFPIRGGGTLD